MPERLKPRLSLNLIKQEAVEIFRANDAYDDEKGLHPNTILRSSEKAVERIISSYGLTPQSLYSALKGEEVFLDLKHLREQGFTEEDIDRNIKAMLTIRVRNSIRLSNPELVLDQQYRFKQYGKLYIIE